MSGICTGGSRAEPGQTREGEILPISVRGAAKELFKASKLGSSVEEGGEEEGGGGRAGEVNAGTATGTASPTAGEVILG